MALYITYAIDSRTVVKVDTDSVEKAKETELWEHSDKNIVSEYYVETRPVCIEDEDGNILWEA